MAAGRRERVKSRIRNEGIEHLEPHEVLEAMLFPYIPRRDTAVVARALLARFGSLNGVMCAAEEDLFGVDGMTRKAAKAFPFQYGTIRFLCQNYHDNRFSLANPTIMAAYAMGVMCGEIGTYFVALDARGKSVGNVKISDADPTQRLPDVWATLRTAIDANATSLFLVRTHAEDDALLPQAEDFRLIEALSKPLAKARVHLLDYLVVRNSDGVSFRQMGLLGARFQKQYFESKDWLYSATEKGYFIGTADEPLQFLTFSDYLSWTYNA